MNVRWGYSSGDRIFPPSVDSSYLFYLPARQALPLLFSSISVFTGMVAKSSEYSSSDNCLIKREAVVLVN